MGIESSSDTSTSGSNLTPEQQEGRDNIAKYISEHLGMDLSDPIVQRSLDEAARLARPSTPEGTEISN